MALYELGLMRGKNLAAEEGEKNRSRSAEALKENNVVHALIVHSDDGMDEISPFENTNIVELKDGNVKEFKIDPKKHRKRCKNERQRDCQKSRNKKFQSRGAGGPPPGEESSDPLNARGRRRLARAAARAESSAHCSLAITCLVVMFVVRIRARAKAGKHLLGIRNGTVAVGGEGASPLRVSPKRSHSELESGQDPSQLIPHHTRGACSLGATYQYPFQPQTRPRVEDGIRLGSVVAVTSKASESTWYVH